MLRKKPCSGIVIGLFGGLTCVYWHSTLEWSLKQNNNFSQQMILYALIGVIAIHRKDIVAIAKRNQMKKGKRLGRKKERDLLPPILLPVPTSVMPVERNKDEVQEDSDPPPAPAQE